MIKIAFTGDIAFSKYFKNAYEKENLLSKEIIDFLSDSFLTVANVEAPVSARPITSIEDLAHVNPLEITETLEKINAKIWNLANNHSMDCGEQGLNDTLEIAKRKGARTIGAGFNREEARKPLIIEKEDIKIGLLSVASPLSEPATDEKAGCFMWDEFKLIKKTLLELKNTCDHVVVISHGGEEFTQIPLPFARDKYHKYLKWGADIVVAHHPHVPQNYERVGNKIIFYSLGNFIFDTDYQRNQRNTDIGVLVKIYFEKDKFTFDSLSIKIDREENVVKETSPLLIFRNIDAKTYKRLLPLAEEDYSINLWSKLAFIKKTEKIKNKRVFFKTKMKRFKRYERWGIIKAMLRKPFKSYRKCDKELVKYISNSK